MLFLLVDEGGAARIDWVVQNGRKEVYVIWSVKTLVTKKKNTDNTVESFLLLPFLIILWKRKIKITNDGLEKQLQPQIIVCHP